MQISDKNCLYARTSIEQKVLLKRELGFTENLGKLKEGLLDIKQGNNPSNKKDLHKTRILYKITINGVKKELSSYKYWLIKIVKPEEIFTNFSQNRWHQMYVQVYVLHLTFQQEKVTTLVIANYFEILMMPSSITFIEIILTLTVNILSVKQKLINKPQQILTDQFYISCCNSI